MAVNALVTERALRELCLLPFQLAIKAAQPRALMASYNKLNGSRTSESSQLLNKVVRNVVELQGPDYEWVVRY
jgi:beta-glucosidase